VLNADRKKWTALGFAMVLAVLFTACGSDIPAAVNQAGTPTIVPSLTPSSTSTMVNISLSTGLTSTPPLSILVWWPAALYPDEKSAAARTLHGQLTAYTASTSQVVTVRVKRNDGLGSIYQTLLSGSVVAQSDMPDLALLRRSDLVLAVAAKLVEQIDTKSLPTADFYPAGLALGQVNGNQYGIPYVLEVQQIVYRTTALPTPPHTLDDLVANGQPILFPAGAAKGVNTTLLEQYLAVGGQIADNKGAPTLSIEPLRAVLHYYEQAAATKIVTPQILDYTSPLQYWQAFLSGKANLVQVDSTTYLAQRANLTNVGTMPILLSASATPTSAIDGWLWVVTTPDPDRQAQALSLLAWLIRNDQQGAFTQAMGVLPSQRSALAAWGNDSYAAFAGTLLEQTAIPPQDAINLRVAAALQSAFADVITGQKTADLAASDAQASVGQ